MGLSFETLNTGFAEEAVRWEDFSDPHEYTRTIASGKALSAVDILSQDRPQDLESTVIIAGDLVAFAGDIAFGKPRDFAEARDFMKLLVGTTHHEVAGVCVWSQATGLLVDSAEAFVTLPAPSEASLEQYLQEANPLNKAAAFSLATAARLWPEVSVDGDVSTVLGISVDTTTNLLKQVGITPPADPAALERQLTQEILGHA